MSTPTLNVNVRPHTNPAHPPPPPTPPAATYPPIPPTWPSLWLGNRLTSTPIPTRYWSVPLLRSSLRIKTAERTASRHGIRPRYLRSRLRRCSNEAGSDNDAGWRKNEDPSRSRRYVAGIVRNQSPTKANRPVQPHPRKPLHSV